ncbi:MAG TPA: alpha/beta hydrolase [Dehalococcoidia bacterium]|jgi:pimeloyl-ACP methyl ester carboxylesterase|nr:alpha/beta hydrolase [Dehalococcoidia bacterium]
MEREVRYCTTEDGVSIAYCVEGNGPPVLVVPWWIDFTNLLDISVTRSFFSSISRGRMAVYYDKRGFGLSQRDVSDLSIESRLLDANAVMDAVGQKHYSAFGAMDNGAFAIALAATQRDRITHLVLMEAYARAASIASPERELAFRDFSKANWKVTAQMVSRLMLGEEHCDHEAELAEAMENSTTGDVIGANV